MDDFKHLDHYEILGIGRSVSSDEIKLAYRQQMRRYHPDRFASARPHEQAYASRRALRINAAYQALSNFRTRVMYDRNLGVRTAPPPRAQAAKTPPPRDHQAELYEHAHTHLNAGRMIQAAATLRELQQINPFYRDNASLLAQAEDALRRRFSDSSPYQHTPTRNWYSLLIDRLSSLLIAGASAATWWRR